MNCETQFEEFTHRFSKPLLPLRAGAASCCTNEPLLTSVDLFVRDMSLVLAPLPDFILHNVNINCLASFDFPIEHAKQG
jgi:hypothetical protein